MFRSPGLYLLSYVCRVSINPGRDRPRKRSDRTSQDAKIPPGEACGKLIGSGVGTVREYMSSAGIEDTATLSIVAFSHTRGNRSCCFTGACTTRSNSENTNEGKTRDEVGTPREGRVGIGQTRVGW